ncbi:U6 snRNA-associated Sm-like protein LSm1 isoform X2 [Hippoglossus stenolepis]|uniref:U6 snRNA-associated Sm-like protein LSm1 isoform X2 n=1 Tax=Hippoglossus stenolepis TaxID=195615 RepID=UPI001FB00C7D|nr:U6 snRNA-associated Sm-like protein LSm1 isoform X2 [Hippoglossus stenolepis]
MNYVPGTASLIDDIDKKHLVLLRDGRTLIGFLRSIDQFANLVFHQTVERIHVGKKFGDIPRGIFIVRGENVVLLGEIRGTAGNETEKVPRERSAQRAQCPESAVPRERSAQRAQCPESAVPRERHLEHEYGHG